MSVFDPVLKWIEQRFHVSQEPPGWVKSYGGWDTYTGVNVSPETALNFTAVWACVRVLSETLASLPLILYERRTDGGKDRAINHPLYRLLHDAPNPEMSSMIFRETLEAHRNTWGNGYAEIEFSNGGQVLGLWPLRPDRMQVKKENSRLVYEYRLSKPDSQGRLIVRLRPEQVFHVKGLGFDGLIGYSPVRMMRNAIALGMAAEEFGSRFFGNGARPGGVLQHPGQLSKPAYDRLKDSWKERHEGLENASRLAILEEGMEYQAIGVPPEDAQFLQSREFQLSEIARIFRMKPHKIGDLSRATFSNIEHESIDFVVDTIRPPCVRWEQEINRTLLTPAEQRRYYSEFLIDGLLRGDIQSRYQSYATARQNGWMNADEIRALENMNPIEDGQGQIYLVPLNMIPATDVSLTEPANGGARSHTEYQPENRSDVELRVDRSVRLRRRLMISHRRLYDDVAGRIINRETNDILAMAKKNFRSRGYTEFAAWLDQFYEEHGQYVFEEMRRVGQSYAELVADAAAEETAFAGLDEKTVEKFVYRYSQAYVSRHTLKSRDKLDAALERGKADGQDPVATLEAELESWRNTRPGEIAKAESVRLNGAISILIYELAGRTQLVWKAFGKSCPYCTALNGKVIGIIDNFLVAGEEFQPEGAETPLNPSRNVRHAPAHAGCDCMIAAG